MIVIVRFVTMFAVCMVRVVMRIVMVVVCAFMLVRMRVFFMLMVATFSVVMIVVVLMREVDIELDPRDALPFVLGNVQMEAIEF